jgi:transcriptional regulator with XRE-family HTH domain
MKTSTATNIKIELLLVGVTQSEIARKLGMSVGTVNDVITGRRSNPTIRAAIAKAIGKPVESIWTDKAA